MRAVLKNACDRDGQTIWEALYINGVKQIEAEQLDEEAIYQAFEILPENMTKVTVFGGNSVREMDFPVNEDFSYLDEERDDSMDIQIGMKVYIDNYNDNEYTITAGWVTVKEIFNIPNSNFIWHTEEEKKKLQTFDALWFSTDQIPGIFSWTLLRSYQDTLKRRSGQFQARITYTKHI